MMTIASVSRAYSRPPHCCCFEVDLELALSRTATFSEFSTMSAHPPRVAVLVDTSTLWGRSAVKGIVDYIRTSNRWVLSIDWRGVHEQLRIPNNWRGEGIIARVTSRALARQIKALKI